MSEKNEQDPREPIDILWNAIPGKRCAICGQDFLEDGSVDVDASFADHLANVHPNTQSTLLTNRQAPVPPGAARAVNTVDQQEGAPRFVAADDWPVWYRERREKAEREETEIPDLFVGETQKSYDERTEGKE